MRVLFTMLPATGSLHPLVPLAHALREADHQVTFACAARFQPMVRRHGFDSQPTGIDFLFSQPDYLTKLVAEAGGAPPDLTQLTGQQRLAWVTNNLFIAAAARRMLPDVIALAKSWRPDIIVRESSEFSGCLAAETLDLPHASVAAAADAVLDQRELSARALDQLRSGGRAARRPGRRDALPIPAPLVYAAQLLRALGPVPRHHPAPAPPQRTPTRSAPPRLVAARPSTRHGSHRSR
jgi:hypothetical protein